MNITTISKKKKSGSYPLFKLNEKNNLLTFILKNKGGNIGLFLSEAMEKKFLC